MSKINKFGFVALMGEPNVGKSSILNTILEKKLSIVSHKVQTTRFRLNGILCERESQIAFIDTPGICDAKSLRERSYNKVAWQCIYDTNIVALVIDAKKGINNQTELIYKRLKSNSDDSIELVVILNKIDLVDKSKLLSLAAHVSKSYGISEIFFVSAKKRLGFDGLKKWLAENIPNGDWVFDAKQISDAPLNFVVGELTREKIFLRLHDELPYDLEVKTIEWKNNNDSSCSIFQDIYVSRDSQKGIVLGKKGEVIKKISIAARKEISNFLGKKVHLFLRVRSKKSA